MTLMTDRPVSPPPTTSVLYSVVVDHFPRCDGEFRGRQCQRVLAEFLARPWRLRCRRCGQYQEQPSTGARRTERVA